MKMKSCVWLVCVLLCMPMVMEGQVIRVDGGAAFSTIRTKGEALGDGVRPFQMSVGMEYCDKGLFNLTSSIGYLRKGMKSPILIQEKLHSEILILVQGAFDADGSLFAQGVYYPVTVFGR